MASKSLRVRLWKRNIQILTEDERYQSSSQVEVEVELQKIGDGQWEAHYKTTKGGKSGTTKETGPLHQLKVAPLVLETAGKYFNKGLVQTLKENPRLFELITSLLFGELDDVPDLKALVRINPNEGNRVTRLAIKGHPDQKAPENLQQLVVPALGVIYASLGANDTKIADSLGGKASDLVGTQKGDPRHRKLFLALIQAGKTPPGGMIDEVAGETKYHSLMAAAWDSVREVLLGLRDELQAEAGAVAALLIKLERTQFGKERTGRSQKSDSFTSRVAEIVKALQQNKNLKARFSLTPVSFESEQKSPQ